MTFKPDQLTMKFCNIMADRAIERANLNSSIGTLIDAWKMMYI